MNRPVIVFDNGDAIFFDSVEEAESWLEPPDIGDLLIYDCEGVRLSAKVELRRNSFWASFWLLRPSVQEVVVISEEVPRVQDAADLRSRISEYLEDVGHPVEGDSLDVLIPQIRKWARCSFL